ncbi:hypothetical protein Mapa_001664 [Marchantia paleacea]|nr:hypothetical protein Mapa_001664 [Marchantia paleacea]
MSLHRCLRCLPLVARVKVVGSSISFASDKRTEDFVEFGQLPCPHYRSSGILPPRIAHI